MPEKYNKIFKKMGFATGLKTQNCGSSAKVWNNITLSFCIPTYNRSRSLYRSVTDILRQDDSDIEVVVLDNGSIDNTLNKLRTIKDNRLSIYSNGVNKGALYNMVHVLEKGKGKFLVYLTDQDYVDYKEIAAFKQFFLNYPNIAGGFCAFEPISNNDFELYSKGYRAVKKIAYKGRHPTGYFFNNIFLNSIKLVERFSDYNVVDLFPLEFAFAEICLMGEGAIYNKPIFKPETRGKAVRTHKSSTTNGNTENAFFLPNARLKLLINYTKHMTTLKITVEERDSIVIETFLNGLSAATSGYRSIFRNEDLCTHYCMESRNIGIKELINIGTEFYKVFIRETKDSLGKNRINQFWFEFRIFLDIFLMVARRIVSGLCSRAKKLMIL